MNKKIVIVGGVAGGATAAARLRRLNEDANIIMFERDEYISFANCGLPYYIGGVIKERDSLLVQTVEGMTKRFNLDIRNLTEVVAVDRNKKTVTVYDKQKQHTYEESFDVLILSPGAKPIKPPINGIQDAERVLVLRNIPDTDKIKAVVAENKPGTAVVIGGGFIGIEMAENLCDLGIKVTLVEKLPQVLRPIDFEMAQFVHQELNTHGVDLILGDGISEFKDNGRTVVLESGKTVANDLVILAIGVVPENTLAKSAALALGPRGHIKTNDKLQTLDAETGGVVEDIYAIGDAIEVVDRIDGSPTAIPLAWPANRQGRLVADHISGRPISYGGSLGTAVAKVFDLTIASTGNNESQLKAKKIPYLAIHAHRANHASYYPGATNIALKLLFSPEDGRILGAQAVGRDGTEKRIDVISTVIRLDGTVRELPDLELCYAPPYSSAKDPVNILGYIASNTLDGEYKFVHYNEIDDIVKNGGYLLDVRTELEFEAGHINGSVNIPLDDLRSRMSEITLAMEKPMYVTCQAGLRAHVAIMQLKVAGFSNIYNLSGGYLTYSTAKYKPLSNIVTTQPAATVDIDNQVVAPKSITEVDARGLQCPGPLMATYKAVKAAAEGSIIKVTATDFGFVKDVESWCKINGHKLDSIRNENGSYIAEIEKGRTSSETAVPAVSQENATIVVFSGALDKAIASMIIAQGAAANGKKVTLFFTFWGLNALRKNNKVKVRKNFIEKMFGGMMPRGAAKLPLSSMNMLGMGPKMIKGIMKKKNVDDIETMIRNAMAAGVKFIACTMSMDLMGIKQEELIDGIEYGGVATYISQNENAGTTLFI
ncbi:MAG: pyridine nucleotide-disulfide oxidoreductase [Clostridiales bacterium GWF2_38_85]|nr:MAG: pyridine nucleotide-disulfide oxidoreductase [Clostridiales bacterium GWF2_38_85]HBL83363.1 pyridine nucleotide-disulfide oxidoreductase [Clostridiales bacterium]